MKPIFFCVAGIGLFASTAAAGAALAVADLVAQHRQLTGQVVDLDGWMLGCEPLDCGIVGREADVHHRRADEPFVSIGSARGDLERRLRAAAWSHVVLRVRVTASCWFDDPDAICTDRAPQVDPLAVVTILQPAKHKPE